MSRSPFSAYKRKPPSHQRADESRPVTLPGGDDRIRTGDEGFADPCLTSWRRRRMERETGFEPATFSLARRCSTPEPLPRFAVPTVPGRLTYYTLIPGGVSSDSMWAPAVILAASRVGALLEGEGAGERRSGQRRVQRSRPAGSRSRRSLPARQSGWRRQ